MVDKENKQKIEVFFTKTGAFRAKIRVTNAYSYEVTVGGECWKEGKGREYEDIILGKCKHLTELVQIRYNELIG